MADNIVITESTSGTNVAADQLGDGTKVQFIKIMDGTLDGTSKAAVGANGLAVDVKASVAIPVTIATAPALVASSATIGGVFRPGIAYTDRSGTVTTGGTAQTLMASNASRKGWRVMNLSTGDLWINDKGGTAAATQPAFKLLAGYAYESPTFGASTAAISIFGATTGQAFEAMEG